MAFNTQAEKWAYARGRKDERSALRKVYMGSGAPVLGAVGPIGPGGAPGVKISNARFRSFCERYLVTRSEFFRTDPEGLAEDQWQCILDAKSAYLKIRQVGIGVAD